MAIFDLPVVRQVKHLLGWILRPRLSYLRLREMQRARKAPPVRDDLDQGKLPTVTVRLARTDEELATVVDLYKRNPSGMNIAPRSMEAMRNMRERNIEFYMIFDENGDYVGNIGYQVDRRILGYLQIEYARRSGGLAMAAMIAAENLQAEKGIDVVYGQVYRDNRRALTTFLSVGWVVDEAESNDEYFVISKRLLPAAD